MRPTLKIGFALTILLALVVLTGVRAEQASVTTDMETEACYADTSNGPMGITTAGVVVTYGPASTLLQIGDYLRGNWRRFWGRTPEERNCRWFPQGPNKF